MTTTDQHRDRTERPAGSWASTQTTDVDAYASTAMTLTREEWTTRAGLVAAQREAAGWSNAEVALGRCPGVSTPEKRAAWHAAYTAAGMPEERRPEAEMTDGRLLVRARAAERAAAQAPAVVYDAQRERHRHAAAASRDAVLAKARGRDDDAAQLEAAAARHIEAAQRLDEIAQSRAHWLLAHTETIAAGEAARAELSRRGITPGAEPDRTTAAEWLEAEARARAEDDAYRTITEDDLAADDISAVESEPKQLDELDDARHTPSSDTDVRAELVDGNVAPAASEAPRRADAEAAVGGALSAAAAEAEIASAAAQARKAAEALADQASQDTVGSSEDALTKDAGSDSGRDDGSDWEADRSRQIAAEHDEVLPSRAGDAVLERSDTGAAAWGADAR